MAPKKVELVKLRALNQDTDVYFSRDFAYLCARRKARWHLSGLPDSRIPYLKLVRFSSISRVEKLNEFKSLGWPTDPIDWAYSV